MSPTLLLAILPSLGTSVGTPGLEEIQAAVRKAARGTKHCYDEALRSDRPSLAGKVELEAVVADGRLKRISSKSQLQSDSLDTCICGTMITELAAVALAHPEINETLVVPFNLAPADGLVPEGMSERGLDCAVQAPNAWRAANEQADIAAQDWDRASLLPPGVVRVTKLKAKAGLGNEGAAAAIQADLPPLAGCYREGRIRDKTLAGELWLEASIGPDGRFAQVEITKDPLGGQVGQCIKQHLMLDARWPAAEDITRLQLRLGFSPE